MFGLFGKRRPVEVQNQTDRPTELQNTMGTAEPVPQPETKKRCKPRVRRSGAKASSLAARVLRGHEPTPAEIRTLAASVLAQDTVKGQDH